MQKHKQLRIVILKCNLLQNFGSSLTNTCSYSQYKPPKFIDELFDV